MISYNNILDIDSAMRGSRHAGIVVCRARHQTYDPVRHGRRKRRLSRRTRRPIRAIRFRHSAHRRRYPDR